MYTLCYLTTHFINYSIFNVNKFHYLHHINENTNLGPDICDIIFGTKNNTEKYVEDTSHCIPNIIIITIIVLFFKYLCKNEILKNILLNLSIYILLISSLLVFLISLYLISIE